MYTLKSTARRGTSFVTALAVAAAAVLPAVIPSASVYADALNPLTDRSLTLSSGSPGWASTDGSGNATYAQPNSGANGAKTGNTFQFKTSTDSTDGTGKEIKAFTFQYCTTSAGNCLAPGNGSASQTVPNVTARTSNLHIQVASPSELNSTAFGEIFGSNGNTKVNEDRSPDLQGIPARDDSEGNFAVLWNNEGTWVQSTGWTMIATNRENGASAPLGTNNYITLYNTDGELAVPAGAEVKIVFFATDDNYITNPGAGAFFVKINDYNVATPTDGSLNETSSAVIDGGVTVANVMNQSIQITTKVLETMDFSVGTVDPYTLQALADDPGTTGDDESEDSALYAANGKRKHGVCDPILKGMTPDDPENVLQMGNENGEFSLETDDTYSTHSYWRLSSNSSAGATVYYAGVTLSNTVGDKVDAIGNEAEAPSVGTEQFGLALANGSSGNYGVNYAVERTVADDDEFGIFENGADNTTNGIHASVTDNAISDIDANESWHSPQLFPLLPTAEYGDGAGVVNSEYGEIGTSFAFDETSNTIPVALATQDTQVVDCVTAKMRYIANIAATTPAGIYTTKINYIAAPQY